MPGKNLFMKKLAIILGLLCSFAMAEDNASNPINKTATNTNSQPKLIMVKGTSSNQPSYATSTRHAAKKHTSHTAKSKSHAHSTNHKAAKKTKHSKATTKKVTHKSKTSNSQN